MTITLSSWEMSRIIDGDLHARESHIFPLDPPLRSDIFIDTTTGGLVWGEGA